MRQPHGAAHAPLRTSHDPRAVGRARHHGAVGLTLVTGPANSAKAQVVLERYRAALARGAILVVPRAADVEHYRRELAGAGGVLGVRVEPFGGLLREIARARRLDRLADRRARARAAAGGDRWRAPSSTRSRTPPRRPVSSARSPVSSPSSRRAASRPRA